MYVLHRQQVENEYCKTRFSKFKEKLDNSLNEDPRFNLILYKYW